MLGQSLCFMQGIMFLKRHGYSPGIIKWVTAGKPGVAVRSAQYQISEEAKWLN